MITWMAILLSLAMGLLFWIHPFDYSLLIMPVALLIRMALNALDGMMARIYNMQSKSGELLNELGDVVSDFLMFFPLIKLPGVNIYIVMGFLFLSIVNEFTGVLGKAINGVRRYDGPMGKSDRAFLIGVICLILYFLPAVRNFLNYIFDLAILLLMVSTSVRIKKIIQFKPENMK